MTPKRFHELDLLRFVAAAAVLLFHYTVRGRIAYHLPPMPEMALAPVTKYGFLGVNLFFIISGFVILMTAASGSVRHFVVSRFVRLYPAFWICCTATFVASLLLPSNAPGVSVNDFLLNLTMVSGFVGVPSVDGVYWSLLVEMKFYFLVFVVLLFRQIGRVKSLLGLWLALYVVQLVHPLPKIIGFFLLPQSAPYFIAGAILYLVSREGLSPYKGAMLAICYGLSAWEMSREMPGMTATLHASFSVAAVCAILAAFFLVGLLVSLGWTARFVSDRWILLGALTYPLYLLHQRIGYSLLTMGWGRMPSHLLFWGTGVFMLGLAYLVTRAERLAAPRMRAALLGARPRPELAPTPNIAA